MRERLEASRPELISDQDQNRVQGVDKRLTADHSLTLQMVLLFTGRMLAFVLAFAVPLILVRIFSPAEYGLYKQLLLIHGSLTSMLALGVSASLFYFVPGHPDEREAYIFQTLIILLGLGMLGAGMLVAAKVPVARALNNPNLEMYIPYLGLFIVLSMITSLLDSLMIIFKQAKLATVTIVGFELLRATLMIASTILTRSMLTVLVALLVWELSRLTALLIYLRGLGIPLVSRPRWDRVLGQLRYSIPFGLAVIVSATTDSLHQYVVSYLYDPATFAIYSVGYLQIPVVSIAFAAVSEVTLVRLTELCREGKVREAIRLIGDAVAKLCLCLVPLYVWLMMNASDLVVLLFTERFKRSVEIFIIFLSTIPMIAIVPDYVTRAFSDTGFILRVNVVRLALSGALLVALVRPLGPVGAALATVLAMGILKVLMLLRIRHLLAVRLRDVLPWARVGRIFATSLIAGVAAWVVHGAWRLGSGTGLLLSGFVFMVCYAVLIWNMNAVTSDEKRQIREVVHRLARSVGVVLSRPLLLSAVRHGFLRHGRR